MQGPDLLARLVFTPLLAGWSLRGARASPDVACSSIPELTGSKVIPMVRQPATQR